MSARVRVLLLLAGCAIAVVGLRGCAPGDWFVSNVLGYECAAAACGDKK